MATDQELNAYMSVKKYAPYRKEAGWDHKRGERLKEFKTAIGTRMTENGMASEVGEKPKKKRKGKKERLKSKAETIATPADEQDSPQEDKKRKQEDTNQQEGDDNYSRKKRRRHKS